MSESGRGMKSVELYAQVRYAVQIEGVSRQEAARRFGIDPRTVAKMLERLGDKPQQGSMLGAMRAVDLCSGAYTMARRVRRAKVPRRRLGAARSCRGCGLV